VSEWVSGPASAVALWLWLLKKTSTRRAQTRIGLLAVGIQTHWAICHWKSIYASIDGIAAWIIPFFAYTQFHRLIHSLRERKHAKTGCWRNEQSSIKKHSPETTNLRMLFLTSPVRPTKLETPCFYCVCSLRFVMAKKSHRSDVKIHQVQSRTRCIILAELETPNYRRGCLPAV
jgi:hypothetical protein